jgi:hypothetical protein
VQPVKQNGYSKACVEPGHKIGGGGGRLPVRRAESLASFTH